MTIRAVATDIDATLTDVRRRISVEAVEALRKAEANSVSVILVSGNVLPMCHSLNIYLGFSGPIVAENGGVVFWKSGPRLHMFKDRLEADRGFEYLSKKMPLNKVLTDRWRQTEVAIEEKGVDLELVRRLLKEGGFNLYANSTGYGIHIMEPGLSKLAGLEMALSWIGVRLDDTLAMGDSETDMDFLERCGKSGVPSNAPAAVRQKADFVAPREFGEGAVDILRHFKVI